jgi:hypothetical protein
VERHSPRGHVEAEAFEEAQGEEEADGREGFEAEADDLGDEADDVFGVVGAVGVEADGAAGGFGDLVLIDHPIEGATVAEAIVEGFRRNAGEGERRVDDQGALVLGKAHFVFDPVGEGQAGVNQELKRIGVEPLAAEAVADAKGLFGNEIPAVEAASAVQQFLEGRAEGRFVLNVAGGVTLKLLVSCFATP